MVFLLATSQRYILTFSLKRCYSFNMDETEMQKEIDETLRKFEESTKEILEERAVAIKAARKTLEEERVQEIKNESL